jgi:hypothetical protein
MMVPDAPQFELFEGFNRLLEALAELLISGDRQDREFARSAHPFESSLQVIERRFFP